MFTFTSRYHAIETATYTDAEGRSVAYKRRRLLPPLERLQPIGEVIVAEGDRIDLIAARTMGGAEQFWMVCDGNTELHPDDLMRVGRRIRIHAPTTQEAVARTINLNA
jgi:hypothetical protein